MKRRYTLKCLFIIFGLVLFVSCSNSRAQIHDQVIFDKDGITITAKKIDYNGQYGPLIVLETNNTTERNISVTGYDIAINGIKIPITDFYSIVPSGEKVTDTFELSWAYLEEAEIKTIKDIELNLMIDDHDTIRELYLEKGVKITTDDTKYTQKYNGNKGKLIVDQNDVKIYIKNNRDGIGSIGDSLMLYFENNTGDEIYVMEYVTAINGIETTFQSNTYISTGRVYKQLEIYNVDSYKNSDNSEVADILKVDNLDIKFIIKHNSDTLFETDTKKVTFK